MSAEMDNLVRFAAGPDADHVWVYRVCDPRGYSYGGRYQWPTEAGIDVEFDDWRDDETSGGGGHGWLLGMGDADEAGACTELLTRGLWYLLRVPRTEVRILSNMGKVKFRRCYVERVDRDRSRVLPDGWLGVPIPKVSFVGARPMLDGDGTTWSWAWLSASNSVRSGLSRLRKNLAKPIIGHTVSKYSNTTAADKATILAGLWHGPYDWGDQDFPFNPAQCHDMIKPARVFIRWQTSDEPGWHAICRGEARDLNDWSDVSPPHRWWRNGAYWDLRCDKWYELLPDGDLADGTFTDDEALALSRAAWELPR